MLQRNRTGLKILAGPEDNFGLHSLNGRHATPLFEHLGSSSWHSYDSFFMVSLGQCVRWTLPLLIVSIVCILLFVADRCNRITRAGKYSFKSTMDPDLERRAA